MKAVVYTNDPDHVRLSDVHPPVPNDGDVLVRVTAASVNPADWRIASGMAFVRRMFRRKAKATIDRPGLDFSGVVEGVGRDITRFKIGDEVFGTAHGAFSEYACAREDRIAVKPRDISFAEAAAVPIAGVTALQGLRDHGRLQPGDRVLVNGAAGGVGTYSVQIAKALGAHVTGVCSARNVEMVRSLGADRVIDYTSQDVVSSSDRYDLVLDNVGNLSVFACRRLLKHDGIVVMAGAPKKAAAIAGHLLAATVWSWFFHPKMLFFIARINSADLSAIAAMMAVGKLRSVIDRHYPLSEVPDALRYLEQGHARAKVIIDVSPQPTV